MKITEHIVETLEPYIRNRNILEVACGDSEFSINASKYAKEIVATDISLHRFKKRNLNVIPSNIIFEEMDAKSLNLENEIFDTTVCYNGLGHLDDILKEVVMEMDRVTKSKGYIIFIATWKMDKKIVDEVKEIFEGDMKNYSFEELVKEKYKILIVKKN